MAKFDLHIHSAYSSDGELEISEILNLCIEQKIGLFSLTDHNSVKGNAEMITLAKKKGIDFIPGIEIDCNYEGIDLHVLGYNINHLSHDFELVENEVASRVTNSFDSMIENITKQGFLIDKEAVITKAAGKLPSGELIAEVMLSDERYYTSLLKPYIKGGERSDMPYINFYLDWFAQGKPAFVPVEYMSYSEAIELIHDNGGIAIVAHPGLNLKGREELVEKLLDNGAEGLEVFNNYHNMEQIQYFASVVERRKSFMTCGSDFHGKNKPLIRIGHFNFDSKYETYLSRFKSSIV